MARPPKWNTPTVAVRLPSHTVEACMKLAIALDQPVLDLEPDPQFAEYADYVQNLQPHLFTIQDAAEFKRYWIECKAPTFEEYKLLCEMENRLSEEFNKLGLNKGERLYVVSRMIEEVFDPMKEKKSKRSDRP